jgi:drug/metabolite transporter (DMT)-like permease
MTTSTAPAGTAARGLNGWVEAAIFAVALSVLNIAYGLAFQLGAHTVAFIGYAVIFASLTLLAITGPGPDWRKIVWHPLSFGIGGGIIAMEGSYFLLMTYVTPAEGSLLVRLNVPTAAVLAMVLAGRRTPILGLLGHAVVVAAILWYVPALPAGNRTTAVLIGVACGFIMTARWFATEYHTWNRAAANITEKMRLTGLVLLVTSLMAAVLVGVLMAFVAQGVLPASAWLPTPAQLVHLPTILCGLFVGAAVLTTMQYFGFSTVVKIGSENFLAATALIPLVTVLFQWAAVAVGILAPVPFDWTVLPSMLTVFAGVLVVIWAGMRTRGG